MINHRTPKAGVPLLKFVQSDDPAGQAGLLRGKGDQMAVDRRFQSGLNRQARRLGHLVASGPHQPRVAAVVQLVAAVFGPHAEADGLALVRAGI